jgi:hypothetical protein
VVGHVELTGRPREQAVTQVAIHTSCCFVLHLVESPGCRVFLTQSLGRTKLERRGGGGGTRCGAWWRDGGWMGGGCWSVGQPTEQWIRRPQATVQEQQAGRAVG